MGKIIFPVNIKVTFDFFNFLRLSFAYMSQFDNISLNKESDGNFNSWVQTGVSHV